MDEISFQVGRFRCLDEEATTILILVISNMVPLESPVFYGHFVPNFCLDVVILVYYDMVSRRLSTAVRIRNVNIEWSCQHSSIYAL